MLEDSEEPEFIKCSKQLTIRHNSIDRFKIGESVFLASNPECPAIVIGFVDGKVEILFIQSSKKYTFPPQCVLQYKYAALVTIDDKHDLCLN